ncbi:MAG TPA: hypothetical protein PK239_03525 [Chitinophagales bacterium]|nr:hypothetical protein [Chitinophagales bacterium]HRK26341.1 hypothetical protein [Chitinophagales bacterium]
MLGFEFMWANAVKPRETIMQDARFIAAHQLHCRYAAVADGAGGMGVFVDKWAQKLVNALPDMPFATPAHLADWLLPIAIDFFETHEPEAEQKKLTELFWDEGSAATLCALWLNYAEQERTLATYCIYGDSPCMRYQPNIGQLMMPPHLSRLSDFSGRTNLLNWSAYHQFKPDCCHIHSFEPVAGEIILLASDALAQLVLTRYLLSQPDKPECVSQLQQAAAASGLHRQLIAANQKADLPDFENWLHNLLQTLTPPNQTESPLFKELLYDYYQQGLIDDDDYTLIAIHAVAPVV